MSKTATDTKTENNTGDKKEAAKETDFLEKIGRNLNLTNATEIFKDKALAAMHATARAGKHGMFTDDHFKYPLFGGLQIPHITKAMQDDPETYADAIKNVEEKRAKINTALNNLK